MKKYIPILALSFLALILIVTPASATVRKTGSQGDYFPLTFHFTNGDVPALIDIASINVLFDPHGLSRNPKEDSTAKATPWKHHDIQGLDAPTLEFTSGEPYRIEMDLFFDRYEEGKSVREYTDKIEKLALVHQELHRPPTSLATPVCLVTWGSKTYTCEVEKTQTTYTLFSEDGIPLRAVMNVVFKELSTAATTQFPLQLACVQPPSGIIGWWSGDNTFDLINGNNAVLHDDAGFAAGKVGNAFNLDGIGDYVSIPYSSNLDPSEITVEFWVSGPQMNQQPGNTGGGVILVENSPIHADYEGWYIFLTPSGGIGTAIGNGVQWNPVISNFGLYYPTGWRHVAMTYDGTYLQLYLDGVPQLGPVGNLVSNAQLSTGRDINIGASWNNGNFARFFKGLIDEVEIYDRALSVSEIQSIFNAGSAGKCKPNVCVAPPSELVGWWTLDDAASSSIVNDRAGGNDGVVNGATLGVPGKVSTAADFDGVDDYIEVPDNADLNIADAITIDAWVKLDSLPGGRLEIAEKGSFVNDNGYSFSIFPTGELWFHSLNSQLSLASNTQLSLNTWHHIAVTFEANNAMNFYIDGQNDMSFYAPGWLAPMAPSTEPLRIGRFFDGKIDELEIFDRALSPFEIWSIYNAGTAGKCKLLTPVPGPGEEIE